MSKQKKTEQTLKERVSGLYLAYSATSNATEIQDLAENFSLDFTTSPSSKIILDFHHFILKRSKQANLPFTVYYILQKIIQIYFSTPIPTSDLRSLSLTIFNLLTQTHDAEYPTYDDFELFDDAHAQISPKESLSAPEIFASIATINKPQDDPKKPIKRYLVKITPEQAAQALKIAGQILAQRQLFHSIFSHQQQKIIGQQTVFQPKMPRCAQIPPLSESFKWREVEKIELVIREGVKEAASKMWKELQEGQRPVSVK